MENYVENFRIYEEKIPESTHDTQITFYFLLGILKRITSDLQYRVLHDKNLDNSDKIGEQIRQSR